MQFSGSSPVLLILKAGNGDYGASIAIVGVADGNLHACMQRFSQISSCLHELALAVLIVIAIKSSFHMLGRATK
jgi:hypothetical protein